MKDLLFVIPMKDPSQGKSRLASVLPPPARTRLAVALFRQILTFLNTNQPHHDLLVVTSSKQVSSIAGEYGAQILEEESTGLTAAITQAAKWAKTRYCAICVLPADLADPAAKDLVTLLSYPRTQRSLFIAPAHDGGTNCLIISPPDGIEFQYGPQSCKAHQAAAVASQTTCTIAPLSSFAYDIDTSDDLQRLRYKTGEPWK